jgi:hypothetical protein
MQDDLMQDKHLSYKSSSMMNSTQSFLIPQSYPSSKIQIHRHLLMATSDLHVVYADQFRNHPEGHALYGKVSASRMMPGACGFFSESGQWTLVQEIADIEPDRLIAQGWKPPQQSIRIEEQGGIEWPIRLSESVKMTKVSANATSR